MFHYLIVKEQKFTLSISILLIHTTILHLNRKKSRKNREKERNRQNLFFAKNDFYFSSFSYKLTKGMIQNYLSKTIGESLENTDIITKFTNIPKQDFRYNFALKLVIIYL
jgi:hypothetical protein